MFSQEIWFCRLPQQIYTHTHIAHRFIQKPTGLLLSMKVFSIIPIEQKKKDEKKSMKTRGSIW